MNFTVLLGFWKVGPDYLVHGGKIMSNEKGRLEVTGLTWKYYSSNNWLNDDDTLKVEQ